ncbi:hypothetical protein HOY80DRAFT_1055648 [Tuber brumale]|nr:hypothetical protein HOY80DRAFT_1055648 [Tuber brumale]
MTDPSLGIQRGLAADRHKVDTLHATLEGVNRDTVIDRLLSAKAEVLVPTIVLARGMDVATVSTGANFDITLDQSLGPGRRTFFELAEQEYPGVSVCPFALLMTETASTRSTGYRITLVSVRHRFQLRTRTPQVYEEEIAAGSRTRRYPKGTKGMVI